MTDNKQAEEILKAHLQFPHFENPGQCTESIIHAMHEYAALKCKEKWISVDERLPEYNVSVLVFIPEEDHHCTTGMWDISNEWVLLDDYRVPTCDVTYWRPMFELPEDKVYTKRFNHDEFETTDEIIRRLQKELFDTQKLSAAKDSRIKELEDLLTRWMGFMEDVKPSCAAGEDWINVLRANTTKLLNESSTLKR
jgi:hypothetical protein